MGYGHYHHA
jgi:hypothetical protein